MHGCVCDVLPYQQQYIHTQRPEGCCLRQAASPKRHRPIAAGLVPSRTAIVLHVVLLLLALSLGLCLPTDSRGALYIVMIYYVLNVAYCFGLKRISLLDVMIVAAGFVLRIMAGAEAACITPSHWIVLMTFLLALFLALAKRRDDVLHYEQTREELRSNVVFIIESSSTLRLPW